MVPLLEKLHAFGLGVSWQKKNCAVGLGVGSKVEAPRQNPWHFLNNRK